MAFKVHSPKYTKKGARMMRPKQTFRALRQFSGITQILFYESSRIGRSFDLTVLQDAPSIKPFADDFPIYRFTFSISDSQLQHGLEFR